MADWKLKLRVGQDRLAYDEKEITLEELASRYASKLKHKVDYIRNVMKEEDLADEAEDIAHDFTIVASVEEFDEALERLYDWADTSLGGGAKTCWVEWTAAAAK